MSDQLRVKDSIIELVEYMFLVHLSEGVSALPDSIDVAINLDQSSDQSSSDQAWFTVQVCYTGNVFHKMDLVQVFKGSGNSLSEYLKQMQTQPQHYMWMETPAQHCSNSTLHSSLRIASSGQDVAVNMVYLERPSVPMSCTVFLRVEQTKTHMQDISEDIYDYLHRLKLLNPQMYVSLFINIDGPLFSTAFWHNRPRMMVGKRRLAIGTQHYLEDLGNSARIVPRTGTTYTLNNLRSGNCDTTLKVNVIASLVPRPLSDRVKNVQCTSLQVLFYGPGCVPLMHPSFMVDVDPAMLVPLADYGLEVDPAHKEPGQINRLGTVTSDWVYRLRPVDGGFPQHSSDRSEGQAQDHVTMPSYFRLDENTEFKIQLFVIIEKANDLEIMNSLALMAAVRLKMANMILQQRSKFRRASSTALNKILTNAKTLAEKQKSSGRCVPPVTGAINDLVSTSTNPSFRDDLFSAMQVRKQVTDRQELKIAVNRELWEAAQEKSRARRAASTYTPQVSKRKKKATTTITRRKLDCSEASRFDSFDSLGNANILIPAPGYHLENQPAIQPSAYGGVFRSQGSAYRTSACGSASVSSACGSPSVSSARGSASVSSACGSASVSSACGSASVSSACASASVSSACASASDPSACASISSASFQSSAEITYLPTSYITKQLELSYEKNGKPQMNPAPLSSKSPDFTTNIDPDVHLSLAGQSHEGNASLFSSVDRLTEDQSNDIMDSFDLSTLLDKSTDVIVPPESDFMSDLSKYWVPDEWLDDVVFGPSVDKQDQDKTDQ